MAGTASGQATINEDSGTLLLIHLFILASRTIKTFLNFILSKDAVKQQIEQAVYNAICLKYTGGPLIERRRARRFQVDWQIRVERDDGSQGSIVESGVLRNLSSTGALLSLREPLAAGTRLDVYIRLPLSDKKWMKYPASVVRIEPGSAPIIAAVRFESARPDFNLTFTPM